MRTPPELLAYQLPPGKTLHAVVREEKERLKEQHPVIRTTAREIGPRYQRLLDVSAYQRWEANVRYELLKLDVWDQMGDAGTALSKGLPCAVRRQYPVPAEPMKRVCDNCGTISSEWGYFVPGYEFDSVLRVLCHL